MEPGEVEDVVRAAAGCGCAVTVHDGRLVCFLEQKLPRPERAWSSEA